jgi:hypothetical protein
LVKDVDDNDRYIGGKVGRNIPLDSYLKHLKIKNNIKKIMKNELKERKILLNKFPQFLK